MMRIAPLASSDLQAVATLHCASLTGLLTHLGPVAVRAAHAGALRSGLATGFVARDGRGVQGFVLGSTTPARLKVKMLRSNPAGIAIALGLGIVKRPRSLVWLVKSLRGPDEGDYDVHAAELTYLAVAPDARGSGIGRQLVDAFTAAMRDAGVPHYELSVDDANGPAIAFYERVGFRKAGRYREFGSEHRRYRLQIDPGE